MQDIQDGTQTFLERFGRLFRAIPTATAILQTEQFAFVNPISFLCLLSSNPKPNPSGIEVSHEDAERFKLLNTNISKLKQGIKLFKKRARGRGEEDVE